MTKRAAKIEALRICTGMINAGVDLGDEYWEKDAQKIYDAMADIAKGLEERATKLGGTFNPLTGYEHGKKIII
jgi:hypothetical protein